MKICLTLDADWALKQVTEYALSFFYQHNIAFTFFATDDQDIRSDELCEVAWHPNFFQTNADAELSKLSRLFPGSKGIRPHRLYQDGSLSADILKKYGIKWLSASSSSTRFIPEWRYDLFPDFSINWGDNFWIWYKSTPDFEILHRDLKGFYTINFHPIHIYLNTVTQEQYNRAKTRYHDLKYLTTLRNLSDKGVKDILMDIFSRKNSDQMSFYTISKAYQDLDLSPSS